MIDKMIIDADLCIKLSGSNKYKYLYDILPLVGAQWGNQYAKESM